MNKIQKKNEIEEYGWRKKPDWVRKREENVRLQRCLLVKDIVAR